MRAPRPLTILVLAAGHSSRFDGANKLLFDLDGSPVLAHALRSVGGLGRVLVVTGHDRAAVHSVAMREGAETVHNAAFDRGMGSSIAAGVMASEPPSDWLVLPGDMPFIKTDTVLQVLAHRTSDRPVVPMFDGRRGHPVYFPTSYRDRLLRLDGDEGARSLLADALGAEVNDPAVLRDIDTRQDLSTSGS